ncbi:MAG: 4-amino-4-deoxy-L-arabinose transferase-like glycosyltransferase [Saprospiraceae bacterium]|jgi:4-amino-4-deoxy-L-arabinose transferase-like glycosyltransferase
MLLDNDNKKDIFKVVLLGCLLFLPFLGGVHLFDWDEINFAEAAREMLVTDDYLRVQINYQPFWEKPPLFLWFQAMSMHIFGATEYAARFPNAVCGIATLLLLFLFGKKHFDRDFAWFWVLAYSGSILPHLYFKSGIIDPWFNLFIFLGIYVLTLMISARKEAKNLGNPPPFNSSLLFLSGAFIGLAILTKGPVAYLIIGLILGVNWIFERFKFFINIPQFLLFTFSALFVTSIWFGVEIAKNGTWFTEEFITYQYRLFSTPDAGHKGFFGYHFVVLLIGCFPASLFALVAFKKTQLSDYQQLLKRFMLITFWVVLILFSIVQSKIVHYSSLCYYPLTFLAALTLWHLKKEDYQLSKVLRNSLLILGLIIGLIVSIVPFLGQNIDLLKPLFSADKFALANLNAKVYWTGFESIAGIVLIGIILYSNSLFRQKKITKASKILFLGTAIFIQLTLIFYINNIEGYSQRAAIEFYEELEGEEVYVVTVGFKSYAHLFYARKQKGGDERQHDLNWLLKGNDLDRDAYFVTKIHKAERLDKEKNLIKIGEKNGFVFYKRGK